MKLKKRVALILASVLLLTALVGCGGSSDEGADGFPEHTLTLVINYSAGGGTDLAARALGSAMERILGVPVSPVNKAGGSGTIGLAEIKNSAADGYTFGVCSYAPLVIVPNQLEVSYTIDDFEFLGTILQYDYGVFVQTDSPIQDIDDLVAEAANGGITMMGAGYPHPIVCEGLADLTGEDIAFVNVEGSADAVTGLLGGHADAISLVVGDAQSYIESGELRMIASSMTERVAEAPDVPTLQEQGYDLSIRSYMGIGVPKGTDPERVQILQDAFDKAFEDEDFLRTLENLNVHVNKMSGEEFKEIMIADMPTYEEYFASQGQ